MSSTRSFFSAGVRGFFRCPICRGHLQMHGRVIPVAAALLVALGFLGLDLSGYADVTLATWWWDAFQIFSVLFALFLLLNWLMRIDRRQPMRKFVV